MRIDYLEEFTVCARNLNARQTAEELYITQSSLNRHIKQLEEDLGFSLFDYSDGRMSLTRAGLHLYENAEEIVAAYNSMKHRCKNQGVDTEGQSLHMVAQQHSLCDLEVERYYRLISLIQKEIPGLVIHFAKASRRDFFESPSSYHLDLCLEYRCGKIPELQKQYANRGIVARYLRSEPLAVWCHSSHPFSLQDEVSLDSLQETRIMVPADASTPMKKAVTEACRAHGFIPNWFVAPTTNQPEFLHYNHKDAVYVYPASFTASPLLKGCVDMVSIPFVGNPQIHGFALAERTENPCSEKLIKLLEVIEQ